MRLSLLLLDDHAKKRRKQQPPSHKETEMTRMKKLAVVIGVTALALFALAPERPAGACISSGCHAHRIFICCGPTCWSVSC